MIKTDLSAFDPVTSTYDNSLSLNKIEVTAEDCSQGEVVQKVECAKYTIKEMDYKHLECITMAQGLSDHRALV